MKKMILIAVTVLALGGMGLQTAKAGGWAFAGGFLTGAAVTAAVVNTPVYVAPAPVVCVPPPAYCAPAVVCYAPRVVYARPAPFIYGPYGWHDGRVAYFGGHYRHW